MDAQLGRIGFVYDVSSYAKLNTMAAPAADLPGISDGFRRLRRHTEAAGDMSAAAQDVRARQYERVCENFRILRRKYDSLKEVHQELLWGDAVLAHEGLAAGLPAVDPALVEEAHRVGDVATAATLGSGACSSVLEGAWPDGRPCAVKRISKRDAKTLQEVRNVASELEALRALTGSPHALELQAVLASRDHLYFVVGARGPRVRARGRDERVPRRRGRARGAGRRGRRRRRRRLRWRDASSPQVALGPTRRRTIRHTRAIAGARRAPARQATRRRGRRRDRCRRCGAAARLAPPAAAAGRTPARAPRRCHRAARA